MGALHHPKRIVIIGGGYAGAVTAIKLLDAAATPLSVTVVERRAEIGRGVAYSSSELVHLLNGTAQTSTLQPDDPGHLARWLAENGPRLGWVPPADISQSSPPRWLYGGYVNAELQRAIAYAGGRVTFAHVQDDAVAVVRTDGGFAVGTARGKAIPADVAVLALGVFPSTPTAAESAVVGDPRYVAVPWVPAALDRLQNADQLLLVGASLSMVDVVASMEARGFSGCYSVVSRRGQMVEGRRPGEPWRDFIADAPRLRTVRELLRLIRVEKAAMADGAVDWQGLPSPLRAHALELWQGASDTERLRFTRHLRSFWDVALHRAAPASYAAVERVRAAGRLDFAAGRVLSLTPESAGISAAICWRKTGLLEQLTFDGVINCRGYQEHDWRRVGDPLVRQLLAAGVVRPHSTGFGIDATPAGAIIDVDGRVHDRLFAIGHPLRGVAWESSSVGEQLTQAVALAPLLLAAAEASPALETA